MCGLIGVTGTTDAARDVFVGLLNLQHRGQDGAGILSLDALSQNRFFVQKGSGLVENIFSERTFRALTGTLALGHTRYATIGRSDPNLLQPFVDAQVGVAIAHNGNIVNVYALRKELLNTPGAVIPRTQSDSELILSMLAGSLAGKKPGAECLFAAVRELMGKLIGSYSIVGIDGAGGLFGFRDPHGIRPLVMGTAVGLDGRKTAAMASESVALSYLGYDDIEEIGPGEAVYVTAAGQVLRAVLKKELPAPCMFEWVYFARVESDLESSSVYETRFQLGVVLARRLRELAIQADVVVPVPETSRAAAIAIAEVLDLPFRESLIKNRYVNRTFILDGQEARKQAIRRKLAPIKAEIEGKHCLVVDDSIVRGTTARQIIELMRQCGASAVTLVSTCPPIVSPCYYGIDFPSRSELAASGAGEEELASRLGADRVVFQTIDGLKEALGRSDLCTGCLTGTYPTDVSHGDDFEAMRIMDRQSCAPAES